MSSHDRAGPAGTTRRSSAHLAGPRAGASCYAAADLLVLRAALAPHAMVPDRGPARGLDRGPDGRPAEDPARLHELIQAFRNDPALAAALELASPDLAQTLTRTEQESTDRPASEVRRMVIALTGYLLRLRHRATPFGLFAGTALIAPDTAAGGGIGTGHSLLLRPPPRWLAGLVAALESDFALPDLAPQVRIAPAPSLYRTGPLHVLADRSAGGPGHWRTDTSVRQSGLLDAVLVMAAGDRAGNGGIRYCALLDLLHAAAPALDREKLAGYVTGLLSARFLVTDLLPPPGDADPLSYLIERLDHHPVAGRLDGLRRDLREASRSPRAADIRRLRGQMRSIEPGGADLVADMLLDTDLRVPLLAVREVEHAASVAWSCTPSRPVRSLAGLHQAMLSRYGLDRPVPLAELLDPTESLGLDGVSPQGEAAAGAARDRLLTGLALDALAAGRAELCLDRAVQRRLEAVRGACGFPPSTDVFTEIVAASAEALNRGDFLVVLGSDGGPGPAGSSAGRLAGCLGAGAARLAGCEAPRQDAGPLEVEVVFRPPDPAAGNLVSETGWTAFRIDLAGHPPKRSSRDIALADLYVIATPERLRLYSERFGRDIRPVSFSTLHPQRADAVARLLLALGCDGAAPWKSWDWGSAGALPWLPRVRVGRAVLASARWALSPDLLHLAAAATDSQWRRGLLRWRDAEEVPEVVLTGAGDRQLPLDLADPVHAALLRRECRDHGVVTVTEPPGGIAAWRAAGWPPGPGGPHAAQIVFPLHPRRAPPPGHPTERPAVPAGRLGLPARWHGHPSRASVFLPGGSWLCANLTVPAALQDCVLAELTDQALQIAAEQAEVERWFYVRTADPAGLPQLTLRFHGPARSLNQTLLPALHRWSGQLRAEGLARDLCLASYWPELGRYGGSDCMEAAERLFHRDSRLCLESVASTPGTVPPGQRPVPGVIHILEVMLDARRAVGELPRSHLSATERRLFGELRPGLRRDQDRDGEGDRPPVTVGSHGQGARSAWMDWHAALAAYRSRLDEAGQDCVPIALSLVHMHCNRLVGPSRATERVAVALARDLILTRSARAR